jgi:hypothetical protein
MSLAFLAGTETYLLPKPAVNFSKRYQITPSKGADYGFKILAESHP